MPPRKRPIYTIDTDGEVRRPYQYPVFGYHLPKGVSPVSRQASGDFSMIGDFAISIKCVYEPRKSANTLGAWDANIENSLLICAAPSAAFCSGTAP